MCIFAHFGPFPIILKQNLIFQMILLVIMALCKRAIKNCLKKQYPSFSDGCYTPGQQNKTLVLSLLLYMGFRRKAVIITKKQRLVNRLYQIVSTLSCHFKSYIYHNILFHCPFWYTQALDRPIFQIGLHVWYVQALEHTLRRTKSYDCISCSGF